MEAIVKFLSSLLQHWSWKEKPFAQGQALIDLVILCLIGKTRVMFRNKFYDLEKYQIITSDNLLSERWGWKRFKIRTFLQMLVDDKLIVIQRDKRKTIITLCVEDSSVAEVFMTITSTLSNSVLQTSPNRLYEAVQEKRQQEESVNVQQENDDTEQQTEQHKCQSSLEIERNLEQENQKQEVFNV